MHNESASPMRGQLIQQGRAFFVVSLITMQLAAQYWGTKAPGGAHQWWVPGVWSAAALAVILFIIFWRHPKLPLQSILLMLIVALAIVWGGYALSSHSLNYTYFLGISAAFFLVAMMSCASIYSPHLAKVFKKLLGFLNNWTSTLLLVGLLVSIIRTLADMENGVGCQ